MTTDGLVLSEITEADGSLTPVRLAVEGGDLVVAVGDAAAIVPEPLVAAIVARYGAPFDEGESVTHVGALVLASGATLAHVRHLARFDVVARDYVVYGAAGATVKSCASSTVVAGALRHLLESGA